MPPRWSVFSVLFFFSASLWGQSPTVERDKQVEEQKRVFAEYQRLRHRQEQFHSQNIWGYQSGANPHWGSDHRSLTLTPKYSSQTKTSFVSATTLTAPKDARKAYSQARKSVQSGAINYKAAIEHLKRATAIYPTFAAAWTLLGRIYVREQREEEAVEALQRSVEIDPRFLGPYPDLAYLTVAEKAWPEVVRLGGEMIKVNAVFTLGHYYRGVGLLEQGELGLAEKALLDAQGTPDLFLYPEVHYVLGEVYRRQSGYPLAAREYRRYLGLVPNGFWSEAARRWLSEWETLGVIQAAAASH